MSLRLTPASPGFPARLRALRKPPDELFVDGSAQALAAAEDGIAIVGARAASGRAVELAGALAQGLAARGLCVASGGAIGVDGAAHEGALAGGGRTLVVLGSGVDVLYPPRHRELFRRVVARGGALVSPFPMGAQPSRWSFPRRNEVLAAWVRGVVVVEASTTSGSLQTASAALALGRWVGACPGSLGTDLLLSRGAALVETVDDALAALAGAPRGLRGADLPPAGTDPARALDALDAAEPRDAEDVAHLAALAPVRALRALGALELQGLVRAMPGGRYVKVAQPTT